MKHLTGHDSKLYMKFEKIMPSAQGMDIWEDRAFILYDGGACGVYDLKSRNPKPIADFRLGSYNEGIPDSNYRNHANTCMFSRYHYNGNPIPLLYVTIGSGIGYDEDGYYYRCAVENIVCRKDESGTETYTAETLQIISYSPEGIEAVPFRQPCWGCPAFFMDPEDECLYMFSAWYRTKRECIPQGEQNIYLITRFPLPDIGRKGMIHLTPGDIRDQFMIPSDSLFTQGGTILDGKLYHTFGCPKLGYPLELLVFDLKAKELILQVTDMDEAFCGEEIECCAQYQGKLLCNTCDGSIFLMGEEII